ncbi:hypothetical protein DPEC_G00008330 [Dallia pectoralis]|uniref:Uncharacterized protein n=1 Tax=Dallia pectoralis TaxID=75939 RepID=A0ACC2HLB4_DALPE|nr:hypothetical protein DPEC_G00008330 [Dallia pectoralis]
MKKTRQLFAVEERHQSLVLARIPVLRSAAVSLFLLSGAICSWFSAEPIFQGSVCFGFSEPPQLEPHLWGHASIHHTRGDGIQASGMMGGFIIYPSSSIMHGQHHSTYLYTVPDAVSLTTSSCYERAEVTHKRGSEIFPVNMLRGTVLCSVLAGLCVIVTLCPVSCQLSQEDAETIVELHNTYRGQVVPSAAYMTKMKWDENLKITAESYSVKCVWDHNPDLEGLEMGENLYVSTVSFDPIKATEKWFLEHLNFNFNNNSCQENQMCGHYTQMVWASSLSVGCALHRCDTMEGLSFQKVNFLVCNYFPAGNFVDEKPYEEGEWCSRCPENLPRCDENLCVPESSEDVDEQTTDAPSTGPDLPSTHTAETELESAAPTSTVTDSEEPGTEPIDAEKVKEDPCKGEGQRTNSNREQPQSNVGRVSTSLILSTSLVTLLLLEF